MATKGKERRVTSPSYPRQTDTTQRRRSPNPSPPDQKSASICSEKHVPNYLKPTISSGLDPSKHHHVKKQTSMDTTHKPTLTRRSFDKPPSPSQVPMPQSSPNYSERNLRSLSFCSKTTNPLPKPHSSEKSSITSKDVGKHHGSHPRPANVKKNSTTNSKKQNNASNTTLATKPPTTDSAHIADTPCKLESRQEDKDSASLTTEPEEEIMVNSETNNKKLPTEILILEEDKEHVDLLNDEVEFEGGKEVKFRESSMVSEDQNASLPDVDLENFQGVIHIEENGNNHQEEELSSKDENDKSTFHQEENTFEGEEGGEQKEKVEDGASENLKDNTLEEKDEVDEGNEALQSKELEVEERVAKGSKAEETENVVRKIQGGTQGKKDSAAYNDVIEETATKLREQRKNKVKALVGAFETVISLESEASPE